MRGPSRDQLLSETARLAYHFHWPLDTILDLEHADRQRFLAEAEALAVGSVSDRSPAGDLIDHRPLFDETRKG
jgi:hypothetical protein